MPITQKPTLPLYVHYRTHNPEGPFWSFAEIRAAKAIRYYQRIGTRLYDVWTGWSAVGGFRIRWEDVADCVVIDRAGQAVDAELVRSTLDLKRRDYRNLRLSTPADRQRGPVPGTGHRKPRGCKKNSLRYPSTTPERRWSATNEISEWKVRVRSDRNAANIPQARDEIWRYSERSWKRHRKTQYRV